jgi:hypothetical protein
VRAETSSWTHGSDTLQQFAEEADRKAVDMLEHVLAESSTREAVSRSMQQRLVADAVALTFEHLKLDKREEDQFREEQQHMGANASPPSSSSSNVSRNES